jgi:hypothetical protein
MGHALGLISKGAPLPWRDEYLKIFVPAIVCLLRELTPTPQQVRSLCSLLDAYRRMREALVGSETAPLRTPAESVRVFLNGRVGGPRKSACAHPRCVQLSACWLAHSVELAMGAAHRADDLAAL